MDILYSILCDSDINIGCTIQTSTTNCRQCEGPTAFCRQAQLKQDNGNGLGQRAGTLQLNGIHLCGVTAGNAVLLRYSRQLVGSCIIKDLFTLI